MARNGNNTDAAEAEVYERLRGDPDLLRSMIGPVVKMASSVSVNGVIGGQRAAVFDKAAAARAARASAQGAIAVIASSLLDMPLSDGTLLRDATRFEVIEAAERYHKLSSTMAHRARWLSAIAERVPDGKRIGDAINDAVAQELFERTA